MVPEVPLIPSVPSRPFVIPWREETSQSLYSWCLSFAWVMTTSNHAALVCLFLKKKNCFLISASLEILLFNLLIFPQPNRPPHKDSIGIQSVLLGNSPYLKWFTQFPHLVQMTHSGCIIHCCSSSFAPWGSVVFSYPTGTHPSGIAGHHRGQGHRWIDIQHCV